MRHLAVLASALALLAVPAGAQKFKVTTNIVALYATVTDHEKRLVPDLVQEDFEVLDNGKPQPITSFDNKPQPITVVVTLDTSGSMTLSLELVKRAAEQFLIRLLPDDKALVGEFSDKIKFHPAEGFTSNRDRLVAQLKELDFGYPTRLWDAVNQSMAQLKPIEGRKVVLVFTDGEDTASKDAGAGDVTDRARVEDVMVYSVGLENEYFNGQTRTRSKPDGALKGVSAESGGGFFLLKKTDELGPTFTRIAQELHSQYVIGFSPATLDGKVHKLELRIKKPGMTARARRSYLAAPPASTDKPSQNRH
jgi:Ca-activated chloride channel family protein